MAQSRRISSIDGIKGISSIIIIMYHVLLIPKLEISDNLQFVQQYFGHGVTLFFAISAFSLFLNYFHKIDGAASIKLFFVNRFARISPLFLCLLLFMAVRNWYYTGKTIPWPDFLINIFYIFAFFPGKHVGIIWASWAIGVLFIFYFTAPILMIFIRNLTYALVFAAMTVIAGSCATHIFYAAQLPDYFYYLNFISQFPAFSFGILAYFCYRAYPIQNTTAKTIVSLSGFVGLFLILFALTLISGLGKSGLNTFVTNYRFSICCLAAAVLVYSQSVHGLALIDNRISRYYGKICYSTYLLHPPVLIMMKTVYARIYAIDGISRDLAYLTCCLLTILAVTPLAILAQKLIEIPGDRLLRKIAGHTLLKPDIVPAKAG